MEAAVFDGVRDIRLDDVEEQDTGAEPTVRLTSGAICGRTTLLLVVSAVGGWS